MFSTEQLDALHAAAEAATPGPWDEDRFSLGMVTACGQVDAHGDPLPVAELVHMTNDRDFIAAARTAVPALIEQVRAVAAERDAALSRIARVEALLTELDDGGKSGVRQSSKSSAAAFAHQRLADAIREALTEGKPDAD